MNVLIGRPIRSLALRHREKHASEQMLVNELTELIPETRAVMIGPVRQEILSRIAQTSQFERVRKHLAAFDDLVINTEDFEGAAQRFNLCRKKGIQGSHTDLLLCALAEQNDASIFTTDDDSNAMLSTSR
jgi:predicted nucleic acid-binding protein